MARGNTHCEVEHIHPILLRGHFVHAIRAMGMRIDKARNDRLTSHVNGLCASRNGKVAHFANGLNPVILDQDHGIVDYPAALVRHGDNACAREGDNATWAVRVDRHGQRYALLGRGKFDGLSILGQRAIGIKSIGLRRVKRRPNCPMQNVAIAAPMHIIRAAVADPYDGKPAAR